jgi:hypothetical protein
VENSSSGDNNTSFSLQTTRTNVANISRSFSLFLSKLFKNDINVLSVLMPSSSGKEKVENAENNNNNSSLQSPSPSPQASPSFSPTIFSFSSTTNYTSIPISSSFFLSHNLFPIMEQFALHIAPSDTTKLYQNILSYRKI